MYDIFMSYSRKNTPTATALTRRLEAEDWRVFSDQHIPVGQRWDSVVDAQLIESPAVIVLWSKDSIVSDHVLDEASEGLKQDKLIPVCIDGVEPPFRFRRLHAAKLGDWDLRTDTPGLSDVVEAVRRLVTRGSVAQVAGSSGRARSR